MPESIDWELVSKIVVPIIIALVTAWATLAAKRTQKGTRENAIIDQMQEMISAEREAREKAEAAMRGDIAALQTELQNTRLGRENDQRLYSAGLRIRDGYISALRHHIDSGKPPPSPDWPPGFND